ncbi:MAG: hypothetical protein ACYC6Y_26555 [Thermoguttaceae bacterium]
MSSTADVCPLVPKTAQQRGGIAILANYVAITRLQAIEPIPDGARAGNDDIAG